MIPETGYAAVIDFDSTVVSVFSDTTDKTDTLIEFIKDIPFTLEEEVIK